MKTILATAAGGPSTLSFTRSLRDADPRGDKYRIVGTDCDPFNLHRSEVNASHLSPKANDPSYIPFLRRLIAREKIEFLHSQPEIEAYVIGKHRTLIQEAGVKLFMPRQETIELLRDKWASYNIWRDAGILVPGNIFLRNSDDLRLAYERFGEDIWIRETVGAAGKGSLSRPTFETALHHLNLTNAWGRAVAAEHLGRDTITWQSIWDDGTLVVAQGRKRLNWAFGNRAQSGVTGLTGVGETVGNPDLDKLAVRCIRAADVRPHGIFSVDFTYDKRGEPNPTEINIAKFFTTHHFITRCGCNMPDILVQLAFGEYKGDYEIYNPCQSGMLWIRGIDINPVLISRVEFNAKIDEFKSSETGFQ
jgi:hypothetical protein